MDLPPADAVLKKDAADLALRMVGAQGEREAAALVVHATEMLNGLRVSAGDLRDQEGRTIPSSNLRLACVLSQKVKVGTDGSARQAVTPEWVVPVGPGGIALPAGRTASFLVTAAIPLDAPGGVYTGKMRLDCENYMGREMPVSLEVRPFRLAPPRVAFAMLYTYEFRYLERWDPEYEPASKRRSTETLRPFLEHGRACVKDMAEHGMTHIFPHSSDVLLRKNGQIAAPDFALSVKTARESGMRGAPGWFVGSLVHAQWKDLKSFDQARDAALLREVLACAGETAQSAGCDYAVLVPADEPKISVPEKLEVARKLLTAVRDIAATNRVRLAVTSDFETLNAISDLYDLGIISGGTPEQWDRLKRLGHELWLYDNVATEGHNPRWSRFLYGFLGWRTGLNGIASWTYPLCIGPWDGRERVDLDGRPIPEYDAQSRPINTVVWAAIREGTEDRRYVDTLADLIALARARGKTAEASRGEEVLNALRQTLSPALSDHADLHTAVPPSAVKSGIDPAWFERSRAEIAAAIERLQSELAPR
jgi:hypothetical protein